MAGAGAMSGFTRLLWPSVCEAATPAPLRFAALWSLHGRLDEFWLPKNGETDFDINFTNSSMQALHPFRDQLLILDGLDYKVLYEYGEAGHMGGPVTFLTGSGLRKSGDDGLANNLSLDQFLASKIGSATRFRSLELTSYAYVDGSSLKGDRWISFTTGGNRLPWERDPRGLWNRVFSSLVTGVPSAAEVRATARRKSLLDYLVNDANRLKDRLAGPERSKLDIHLTALRDIESRIDASSAVACQKPAQPAQASQVALNDVKVTPTSLKLFFDLIAQAFACDLTRVVTLPIIPVTNMPWLGINQNCHDDIAHYVTGDAAKRATLNKYHRWNSEMVAYFLGALKNINDGTGTLLDHSLILWGNELGDPAVHSSWNVPWVIAGGTNGKFRTGRYLRLRTVKDPIIGWDGYGSKVPNAVAHNKVLVSIAQAFDQSIDTFGSLDYKGPMAGLT
jgi:hypothetical protein